MVKSTSSAPAISISHKEKRAGDADFGEVGTNKTLPSPQKDAEPSAELQGTKSKYIPKTPYARG